MISACKHGCSPLISEQPRADWQLQYLRSWRYLKNWMGNIFQSAEFILELRSSASPNYEQDIRDNTQRIWHTRPLIGQSDPLIGGYRWHHYQGIWSWPLDRLLRDIDTRLEYFWPKHQDRDKHGDNSRGGSGYNRRPCLCLRSHHTHFGNKTRIKMMMLRCCCCLCLPKGKKLAVNS